MQKLAEICIRRPVFATMLILALVVVGAAAYYRLGVDRFPSVDMPSVSVEKLSDVSPMRMAHGSVILAPCCESPSRSGA